MISLKHNYSRLRTVGRLIERQTAALEAISDRLAGIEKKLDRVATALEREVNLSTHPF